MLSHPPILFRNFAKDMIIQSTPGCGTLPNGFCNAKKEANFVSVHPIWWKSGAYPWDPAPKTCPLKYNSAAAKDFVRRRGNKGGVIGTEGRWAQLPGEVRARPSSAPAGGRRKQKTPSIGGTTGHWLMGVDPATQTCWTSRTATPAPSASHGDTSRLSTAHRAPSYAFSATPRFPGDKKAPIAPLQHSTTRSVKPPQRSHKSARPPRRARFA